MAWNGSGGGTDADVCPGCPKRRPRGARLVVLLSLAVLCVGGVCWHFLSHRAPPVANAEESSRKPIAEASPAVPKASPATRESPQERPKTDVTNFVNDVWHDEKGRPHYKVARVIRPGQRTVINGRPWRPERPVFHHPSEVELDVVLSRRPGERIFGDVNWRAFERDLPKALADRIEILPDDTPDIIARKEAVMEAKKELMAALRDGEDPSEILKAARDDVNRLADVRDNLLVTVAELKQEGASEQEIEDAVAAANRMLEAHGIDRPLVSPRTMRERAEAARQKRMQEGK